MKELDLIKIFDSMKTNDISEIIIKEGSKTYEVRRGGFKPTIITGAQAAVQGIPQSQSIQADQMAISQPQHQAVSTISQMQAQKENSVETTDVKENEKSKLYELKSPLVGTFYGSPKPDSPPFVEVGTRVKKGQTLCIVEAMKNFNEIESEVDGTIREICVRNQELVEFGKVLFRIELGM